MNPALNLSSSPHARDKWTTSFIMRMVLLALLPATVVGIVVNGFNALLVVLVSVAAAVVTEYLFDKVCHKPDTYLDCSAMVTGLMLALCLSADVPLYIPLIGSVFAILVVKCCFGGLGKNFLNPALAARCFLLLSFTNSMTTYTVDGVTSATPVEELLSGKAVDITSMFLGTANGVIGSSVLALLIGGLFLWSLEIIHGEICFSVLGGFTLFMGLFGGQGFDLKFLAANLCGGGVVLGAFFMATDYATSPVSKLGQATYGILIGVLGAMFRLFTSAADSFSYSIIIANLFVPLIDMYILPKPFAYGRFNMRAGMEDQRPFYQRIPRPVIVLTAIALIAGVALSGVFSMTKDAIEEQQRIKKDASFKVVCPDAAGFTSDETIDAAIEALGGNAYNASFGRSYIDEVKVAVDEAGQTIGYVILVTNGQGYDGDITLAVGMDNEGTLHGISFTQISETPGKGMLANEDSFKNKFAGKNVSAFVVNKAGNSTEPEQIDSLSGATITTDAVVNAVNAALDFFRNVVKGGN